MVSVKFTSVSKRYEDGFEAVKSLNLEVNDGEFLVLLGPSGCGKSTTLRMLAGLEEITDGDISIDGVTVNHLPAGARGLGMVFQSYALYPHMTVQDNLTFGLRMEKGEGRLSDEEMAQRVKETATMLELEQHLNKKPKELSGGQRQRVALGRALIRRPKVLLMDEPASGLINAEIDELDLIIRRLVDEYGIGVVLIEHRLELLAAVADHCIVLDLGEVIARGTPREVFDNKRVHEAYFEAVDA